MNTKEGHDEISSAINELYVETNLLFSALDHASFQIRDLEKKLSEAKNHFPFRYFIKEEEGNVLLPLEQRHFDHLNATQQYWDPLKYKTDIRWYFAWEPIKENSKEFRLLLISVKREWIIWDSEDPSRNELVLESDVSKRPIIELKLLERLKYAEYLFPFIEAFKKYLQNYRISITGEIPF